MPQLGARKRDAMKPQRVTMDEFCVKCKCKLFIAKAGREVIDLITRGGRPYRVMSGDVLECPECGMQVVTRFGAVTMQHSHAFKERVERAREMGALEVV